MAPRATRSKAVPKPAEYEVDPIPRLVRTEDERHALLILPKDVSSDARILSLSNPVTGSPTRYLYCTHLGLHELTNVGRRKDFPRSCLLSQDSSKDVNKASSYRAGDENSDRVRLDETVASSLETGYILEDAQIMVATPIDLVYFLTPLFSQGEGLYRPADDYLDQISDISPQMMSLLHCETFKTALLSRLAAISVTQDIGGGELVYRPQLEHFLDVITAKITSAAEGCFPASMEDMLVTKVLDIPVLPSASSTISEARVSMPNDTKPNTTGSSMSASETEDALTCTTVPHVSRLMRQRVAFEFVLSSYIPPKLRRNLEIMFQTNMQTKFMPLEQHLEKVKHAKEEALALRALSDNISRKRTAFDDDDAVEARAEKKRKKEEEEKRKKAETKATKELKKVDTSGMKKLSSFFTRTTASVKVEKIPS